MIRSYSSYLLLLCLSFTGISIKAQVQFSNPPLQGIEGQDFFIVNYVDHDATIGLLDNHCGDKTYDGHQGTDFLLRSFKTMDSGVYVRAVANGRVFITKDSLFDRNKHTNPGGFGNYIGINHNDQYYTYYAHLQKYSLLVQVGDSVVAGQNIAKVACSGNCTDPHVHLEVWDQNSVLVDPFEGPCQSATSSLWMTQPVYDTSLKVIDIGFTPYIPDLDTLRERYNVRDTFYAGLDDTVNFWIQVQGLRTGDSLRTDWYSPGGTYWFSYTSVQPSDTWYYYYWTYIYTPDTPGVWTTKFYVNNDSVASRNFYIMQPAGMNRLKMANALFDISPNPCHDNVFIYGKAAQRISICDMAGREVAAYPAGSTLLNISGLPPGIYTLHCGNIVKKILKE